MERHYGAAIDVESFGGVIDFVRDFDSLLSLHRELETTQQTPLGQRLFKIGAQVKQGTKCWTRSDVNDIIRWKKLQPLRRRIEEGSVDLDKRLSMALEQRNEEDRVNELCRIPGFGPALASAVLALTFPETYGMLDNPSWHALRLLGFDLKPKPYSGGGYTVAEALEYERIIRTLGRSRGASPVEVADALHTFYKTISRVKS